jgi:hypothetical protein
VTITQTGIIKTNATIPLKSDFGVNIRDESNNDGFSLYQMSGATTDSTAVTASRPDSTYPAIASDTAKHFTVKALARCSAGANSGAIADFRIEFSVKNVSGTSSLVGVVENHTINNEVPGDYAVTATVDDTTDKVWILLTGASGDTVAWKLMVEEITVP